MTIKEIAFTGDDQNKKPLSFNGIFPNLISQFELSRECIAATTIPFCCSFLSNRWVRLRK